MPRPIATSTAERIATIIEAAERAAASVVDNAEANAKQYLEEAQAEADRIIAARLSSLSDLTDSLVAQSEAIRRQSGRLLDSLGEAGTQMDVAADTPADSDVPEPTPDVDTEAAALLEEEVDEGPDEAEVEDLQEVDEDEPRVEEPQAGLRLAATPPAAERVVSPPPVAAAPEPLAAPELSAEATPAGARLLATQMAVSGSSRKEIETRLRSGFEIENPAPILDAILGPED